MAKRVKLDPRVRACRAGYAKAKRLAEAANKKLAKAAAKAAERQEKIDTAADGYCALPALVLRDGTVRALSLEESADIVERYLSFLFVDVEHSGYDIGHELYELRTIQLGGEDAAVVFDAADEKQMMIVAWALGTADVLHAFAAIADLIPLVKAGLISWDAAWDKMIDIALVVKLIDPKLAGSDANGLKDLAHDLLREHATAPEAEKKKNELFKAIGCNINTSSETPAEKNGWNMVPKNAVTMIRYAGSDVLDLAAVKRMLPALPVPQSVLDKERLVQKKCARVALDGFHLDLAHIQKKIIEHEASKEENRAWVEEITGGKITNPSAPIGPVLVELWPELDGVLDRSEDTGEPSAAKKSLEKIPEDKDSLAWWAGQKIIAYRHDVTTLGLLLRPLENLCVNGDHRMRPTVYTISADTGRMSCVRPNGQQFSRRGGIRACVCADCGMIGISADFQGCEIKVAAGLSGDRGLLEAETSTRCHACEANPCECGKEHLGLHWLAAHLTFGPDAVKEHRYKAKAVIFRKLFGGAPDSAVAQQISDVFDTQIAPVYKAWDDWLRQCYYKGQLVFRDYSGHGENWSQDIPGRQKYAIYRAYSGRQIYAGKGAHAVGNYAIQGTARELLCDGIQMWSYSKWGDYPLLPVHDQLLTWVPEDEAAEASQVLRQCMKTDVLSTDDWRVEIDVDVDEPFKSWQDSS